MFMVKASGRAQQPPPSSIVEPWEYITKAACEMLLRDLCKRLGDINTVNHAVIDRARMYVMNWMSQVRKNVIKSQNEFWNVCIWRDDKSSPCGSHHKRHSIIQKWEGIIIKFIVYYCNLHTLWECWWLLPMEFIRSIAINRSRSSGCITISLWPFNCQYKINSIAACLDCNHRTMK